MAHITEILDSPLLNLHCENCKSLLSVAPVFITATGLNICGRCEHCFSKPFTKNNHYELLAQQFNFPCRYVTEGCESISNFNLIKKHEEHCPYRQLKCDCNDCRWSGIPIDLIIHYRNLHSKLIIEEGSKQELKDDKLCYILVKSNFYFMLNYELSNSQLMLKLSNLTYPTADASFTCNLLKSHTYKLIESISLHPYEFIVKKITSDSQLFVIAAQLANYIQKSIKCPQCQQFMTPPILKCPSGHITCADCFDTVYNYCVTCEKDDLNFARDHDLESEAAFTTYTCRWAECGLTFSVRDIKKHEINCNKRLYKCFNFCIEDWEGLLEQLIEHHTVCTQKYQGCLLQTASNVTFLCKDMPNSRELEFHLVAFMELFRLMIDFEVWGIKISLINYALPSFYGWYRYEVDLAHSEDPNFNYNKTLPIKHRTCNLFSLDIREDILLFGGYDFLKVTVRIVLLNATERKMNLDRIYQCYK